MPENRGRCPKCGCIFEFASSLKEDNVKPSKGDISICIKCGAVNQFDEFGVVPVDIAKLPQETQVEIGQIKHAMERVKRGL